MLNQKVAHLEEELRKGDQYQTQTLTSITGFLDEAMAGKKNLQIELAKEKEQAAALRDEMAKLNENRSALHTENELRRSVTLKMQAELKVSQEENHRVSTDLQQRETKMKTAAIRELCWVVTRMTKGKMAARLILWRLAMKDIVVSEDEDRIDTTGSTANLLENDNLRLRDLMKEVHPLSCFRCPISVCIDLVIVT